MSKPRTISVGAGEEEPTTISGVPGWFPPWASKLAELYFSGTTSMFVVHGNVFDFVSMGDEEEDGYGTLSDFLAEQLFGRWDLVLHYDLARGLRCLAGRNADRLKGMVALANRRVHDLSTLPKDPSTTLAVLDRFILKNLMADKDDQLGVAIIIDHASYLIPRGDRSGAEARNLVTLLNWATSPYVKRLNIAFVLVDQRLADLSERLTTNPHVATLEMELPDEESRHRFILHGVGERKLESFSDYGAKELAKLTAGIALTDANVLIKIALEGGKRLDQNVFQTLKKRLIERQAQGLLEFIEPHWGLDMVVGHTAAKQRLKDDAELLRRGALESVPMGYLLCGPVGTGKSFLAQCASGSIGIPSVKLKNFRSKYVGETEGNLERVLGVLRGMGPVVVIIDEADAMLGNRGGSGDSGVSSRVFGMIAQQMGNTRYRGKILWMLLTARPDFLPIDLKRQGRAEIHIPLFYPTEDSELRELFVVLARKMGTQLDPKDVPEIPHKGDLSGADIEGLIGRAWRKSLLAGEKSITKSALEEAIEGFMPSTQSLERELQEIAAIIECTDREFLPASIAKRLDDAGGRAKLQQRLNELKSIVD